MKMNLDGIGNVAVSKDFMKGNNVISGTITIGNGGANWSRGMVNAVQQASQMVMQAQAAVVTAQQGLERARYGIGEKVEFLDGEVVEVDLSYYGLHKEMGKQWIVEGVIVGKQAMDNYDNWIVDFGELLFQNSYNYRAMVVPTVAMIKPELMKWEE